MTVWTVGDPSPRRWREDLATITYHYRRLMVLVITGTDPKASKP